MKPSHFLLLGAVGIGAEVYLQKKRNARKKKLMRGPRPFTDSACKTLASPEKVQEWFDKSGTKALEKAMKLHPITPEMTPSNVMKTITAYVEMVLATAGGGECKPWSYVESRRLLYKAVWCNVMAALTAALQVDEELEDIISLCADPYFHPVDDAILDSLHSMTYAEWEKLPEARMGPETYQYGAHVKPNYYYSYLASGPSGASSLVVAYQNRETGERFVRVVPSSDWSSGSAYESAEQVAQALWSSEA